MTKIELTELVRNDMLDAMKVRDSIDHESSSENYGYYHGQFRAYESVLRILTMFDIEELSDFDTRLMRI